MTLTLCATTSCNSLAMRDFSTRTACCVCAACSLARRASWASKTDLRARLSWMPYPSKHAADSNMRFSNTRSSKSACQCRWVAVAVTITSAAAAPALAVTSELCTTARAYSAITGAIGWAGGYPSNRPAQKAVAVMASTANGACRRQARLTAPISTSEIPSQSTSASSRSAVGHRLSKGMTVARLPNMSAPTHSTTTASATLGVRCVVPQLLLGDAWHR